MLLPNSNPALQNLSAIVDFSNNINSNLNIDFALNNLLLTCFGKLHITRGVILLFEDDKLLISLEKGLRKEVINTFPVIKKSDNFKSKLKEYALQNNFELIEEITSSEKLLGFILLGSKLTKKPYSKEDKQFISTILKIGSTTIGNAQNFHKLTKVNKLLDSKINQLNSLFDLGKEFSSILEKEQVSKLLVYSISAQMLVSKYAIVIFNNEKSEILNSKYDIEKLNEILCSEEIKKITQPTKINETIELCEMCTALGIELIVPMTIKNKIKGLIFLGKRITKQEYSKSDIEFLASIASFAVISIENSRLFAEAIEKQKIEKDLEIARNIQQNLLPSKIPKSDIFQIAAINNTAKQVGGDFYDVVELENNRLLIAIADVSGKGVQASLLMANLQAFLKSIYKQNYNLGEASNFLNDLVSENTTNGSFITFFWGILDLSNNNFTYVNMGHNPPLLIRKGKIIKLKKGGMILGVMETIIPYEVGNIKLERDDTIILFTDGITEAMNKDYEEYSDERLEELCLKIPLVDADKILNNILEDVYDHTKEAVQSDDITSMIFKIK